MSDQLGFPVKTFLAPACVFVSDGRVFVEPGLFQTVRLTPLPRGISVATPPRQHVEIATAETPLSWARQVYAVVPPGGVSPETPVSVLSTPPGLPADTYLVVMDGATAPAEWERLEVAVIPDEFWNAYGDFYAHAGKALDLFGADYRVRVSLRHTDVPPTWVQEA